MLLRLQLFDVRRRDCPLVAYTLTRAYPPEYNTDGSVEEERESNNMLHHLHISDGRLQAIQQSTDGKPQQ